jgi:hypothetical protein
MWGLILYRPARGERRQRHGPGAPASKPRRRPRPFTRPAPVACGRHPLDAAAAPEPTSAGCRSCARPPRPRCRALRTARDGDGAAAAAADAGGAGGWRARAAPLPRARRSRFGAALLGRTSRRARQPRGPRLRRRRAAQVRVPTPRAASALRSALCPLCPLADSPDGLTPFAGARARCHAARAP